MIRFAEVRNDRLLERVAAVYLDAARIGAAPTTAVADAIGCNYDAARKLVKRARACRFLPAIGAARG